MAVAARVHVLDARAVAFAELARDVEAEPRALGLGGEERLEEMRLRLPRYARAVVDDVDLQARGKRRLADDDAHRPRELAPVAPRIAREVPQHLVQVLAIEPQALRRAH